MKIKEVCAQTALTDRAIRYYIDEGLLAPAATQNYAGRRALDFSEEDVATLDAIATLRKFGFTVEEIRRILADPAESVAILADVQARKAETVQQEQANLEALARLDSGKAYTAHELAAALTEPVREVEVPREDRAFSWKEKLVKWLKATPVVVTVGAPVAVCVLMLILMLIDSKYPVLVPSRLPLYLGLTALGLLPTLLWAAAWVAWFRWKDRGCLMAFMSLVCVLWLPVTLFTQVICLLDSPFRTGTANPAHYLQVNHIPSKNELLFSLFPAQPRTVMQVRGEEGYTAQPVDVRYFYNYDRSNYYYQPDYEVFAEWTLSPAELTAEIERVRTLFASQKQLFGVTDTLQQGSFTLLRYQYLGDYAIFAWDEQTGCVRYLYLRGTCEPDAPLSFTPQWLALDWGDEAAEEVSP